MGNITNMDVCLVKAFLFVEPLCPDAAPAGPSAFLAKHRLWDLLQPLCPDAAPAGSSFSQRINCLFLFEPLSPDAAPEQGFTPDLSQIPSYGNWRLCI